MKEAQIARKHKAYIEDMRKVVKDTTDPNHLRNLTMVAGDLLCIANDDMDTAVYYLRQLHKASEKRIDKLFYDMEASQSYYSTVSATLKDGIY